MGAGEDPYAVLGVRRGASAAEIHAAYRAAVRRTHPDAGGSSAAFEAVQSAYEALRDPARPGEPGARATPRADAPASAGPAHTQPMEDLLAEAQRLEDEARRLAGMAARQGGGEESGDSVGAVLRDAGTQLREAADQGVKELRRFIRRRL